jgi:hypothetical protein
MTAKRAARPTTKRTAKRTTEQATFHDCPWCGGLVRDDDEEFGGCCSEVCRLIIEDGLWPSPVGPATHEEMQGWIDQLEAHAAPSAEEEPPDE